MKKRREYNEFTIIQEQSRKSNNARLQEMRAYYDDESGILRDSTIREHIINTTMWCSLVLMINGMYGGYSMLISHTLMRSSGVIAMTIMSLTAGALINLYTAYSRENLRKAGLIDRYNSFDMLLFWLLDDDEVRAVKVGIGRKSIKVIRDDYSIRLRIKGFKVIGRGEYAREINLDKKVIVLGD